MIEKNHHLKKIEFDDYEKNSFWIFMEFFHNLTCFNVPQNNNESKEIREKKFQREIHKNIIGQWAYERK